MNFLLESYQNKNVVERFAREHDVSMEKSNELFSGLKKFLANSIENPEQGFPTQEIDEIWHTFILHTKDYSDFCNTHFGTFIHHAPCDPVDGINCSTTR